MIKRPFSTIAQLKAMLDGYRLLFDSEPEVRITAHSFTSPDFRVIFNRLGQGYSVGHIGSKYVTLVFDASDGEDTQPFKFDPTTQEETLIAIFG